MDKKDNVYLSGLMGNQMLRCFLLFADCIENNYEVETITITNAPNYLEQLFELKVPVMWQPGEKINDIDHNAEENVARLFKYRNRIIEEGRIKLKKPEKFIQAETCIHMRGRDKKVAPLKWFYSKARTRSKSRPIHICTDDRWRKFMLKAMLKGTGTQDIFFTSQNHIEDWFTIFNAEIVYCSSSSFPLSTLLFNPDKEIIICSRKSTSYDYQIESRKIAEFAFIEAAMKYCPNLRFED